MESVFWTSPGQSSRSTATPCLFTSTLSAVDFDRLPRRVLRVPTRLSMARGELVLVKRRRVPRRTRAIRPSAIFRHLTRSASPSLCFTGTSASVVHAFCPPATSFYMPLLQRVRLARQVGRSMIEVGPTLHATNSEENAASPSSSDDTKLGPIGGELRVRNRAPLAPSHTH